MNIIDDFLALFRFKSGDSNTAQTLKAREGKNAQAGNSNIRHDILVAAKVFGENQSANEETIVEQLMARGFSDLDATLLAAFVPLAFGRVVISRLSFASPNHLSNEAMILDCRQQNMNSEWPIKLANIPQFVVATQIAEENRATGIVPEEEFWAVCGFSGELHAIEKTTDGQARSGGLRFSPPVILGLAEMPGFDEWYRDRQRT